MVVDDTLSIRMYSFIDNISIIKTIKEIKQKIDVTVFCVRHLGLIETAVTINGFTPVITSFNRRITVMLFNIFAFANINFIIREKEGDLIHSYDKKFNGDEF